jgi:hypothetical protein
VLMGSVGLVRLLRCPLDATADRSIPGAAAVR